MAEHRRRLLVWLGVLGDDDERSGISAAEELDGYLKAARDGRTKNGDGPMKLRNAVASALILTAVTGCDLLIGPAWGPVPPEDYTDTNGTVIPCEWQSVQMPDTYATSAEGVQEIFTVDEATGVHAPLGLYVYVSKVADDEWAAYPGGWVTPVWGCAHAHGKVS